MLGTFSNGTGVNAAPYGYTMAGKTGTTETSFNKDLSGDQWVIGYTPDVVISQWLGFPTVSYTHLDVYKRQASLTIENNNVSTGSFDAVIRNVVAPNGVKEILVPSWSLENLSLIHIWLLTRCTKCPF